MFKPWRVATEVEIFDGVYTGRKEAFKHKLAYVLNFILISTECKHAEDFDGWIVQYNLSEQIDQRQSSCLT